MLLFPPIFHGVLGFFLVSIMALSLFVFPEIFAEEWTIEIQNGASEESIGMAFVPDKVAFAKGDTIKVVNNDSADYQTFQITTDIFLMQELLSQRKCQLFH